MKLNPDCVRDILLYCEEVGDRDIACFEQTYFMFNSHTYNYDETYYHLKQCEMYGFFSEHYEFPETFDIIDISPAAHEFLSNVRENSNWNRTKEIAEQIGTFSLSVLTDIAAKVIDRANGKDIT